MRGRSRWTRSSASTRSTSRQPDLATPTGDLGRLFDALRAEWGLTDLRADLAVVRALQPALTAGRLPRDGRGPRRPRRHRASGRASTTGRSASRSTSARRRSPATSSNLTDGAILASAGVMNPQIRFGEDLMSRVSLRDDARGRRRRADRRRCARRSTGCSRRSPTGPASSAPRSSSWRSSATRSCTTCCSASTRRRSAPRRSRWPPTRRSRRPPPSSASAPIPGARVYVLPCIAGHVGADTAGVILAEEPHEAEAT